jgi:hypothetical protein
MGSLSYALTKKSNIINLFKGTNIKIAFSAASTVQKYTKGHIKNNRYESNGINTLRCIKCPLKYIGQSGRASQ